MYMYDLNEGTVNVMQSAHVMYMYMKNSNTSTTSGETLGLVEFDKSKEPVHERM